MTASDGSIYGYSYGSGWGTTVDRFQTVTYPGPGPTYPTISYLYETASLPYALTGIVDENGNRYATYSYDSSMRSTGGNYGSGVKQLSL